MFGPVATAALSVALTRAAASQGRCPGVAATAGAGHDPRRLLAPASRALSRPLSGAPGGTERSEREAHHGCCHGRDDAFLRPEARHLGPAQEGPGLSAAALCRELRPVDLRQPRGLPGRHPRARRRRALSQPRGRSDRPQDGGGQRLRPGDGRPGRAPLDAGRLLRHPRAAGPSAGSSCPPATIPAARTAISASSTISAMAVPAPEKVTEAIFARTKAIKAYRILEAPDVDLDSVGEVALGEMTVEVIDPVADYRQLMDSLFDFALIRELFASGFTMRFDAMHAVTGPLRHGDPRGRSRRREGHGGERHAAPRLRRPPSRPEPGPRQGSFRPHDVQGGARPRRRLGRRRRPQPDPRPRASSSRPPTAWRCSPPMPIWPPAIGRASRASPARCRPAAPPTGSP